MTDHSPDAAEVRPAEENPESEAGASSREPEDALSSPSDEESGPTELEEVVPKPIEDDVVEVEVAPKQVESDEELFPPAEDTVQPAGPHEPEPEQGDEDEAVPGHVHHSSEITHSADDVDNEEDEDEEEEEEEEEDDEPKLKYVRLTQHLGPVYRNGDATGAFLVAGDKMVIGTLDGNIHVIQLPVFQSLRIYHAHSASVTSVSISPNPPPLPTPDIKPDPTTRVASASNTIGPGSRQSVSQASPAAASRRPPGPPPVPNIPSNNIYIGTASQDGNVCVQSLVDVKDVQLRNFSRPVQAVALSPDFKNDRTYLSGGLAGQLIMTTNAPPGRSTSTTTGATAQAAGWFGNMVGANNGKDTVLHSGEGTITTIKWSLSGKYVAWLNEHGIKIMRSKLYLENENSEDAWKRIGHIDRPQTEEWDAMAAAWKGRAEWIDEQAVESDENSQEIVVREMAASPATEKLRQQQEKNKKFIERLLVGWGGTIWIIHVHPGGVGVGKDAGERSAGRAEIVKLLRMDCIISGISLYTQNLLLVLAYCLPEDDDDEDETKRRGHKHQLSSASTGSEPSGGRRRRQNNQPPELRLIDLTSQAEVDKDGLSVSRFERLNASDYHLGVLPAQNTRLLVTNKGALETIAGFGADMLNAAINPRALFSSAASIRSKDSDGASASVSRVPSTASVAGMGRGKQAVHPNLVKPGVKIFIHSPYDCILATKRDLGDHLGWLLERQQYQQAWELVDEHPEIMVAEKIPELAPGTPDRSQPVTDDFYEETSSMMEGMRNYYSSAEKEKRRIGELWVQQLVNTGDWPCAGQVCGKVLRSPDRWEKWVFTFASADRLDDIAYYMPTEPMVPPIPGTVYEVVLGHYIQDDKPRFRDLLERWSPELFDINTITTALENQLKYREVREDRVDDGEVGRDWRIVVESLARLHEANGRAKEALRYYIKLQDADAAMRLVKERHLAEAVADDIPAFIGLRVPPARLTAMTRQEVEEATAEAITLLVDEAQHGLVKPDVVVSQLEAKRLNLYIYLYLRGLWRGEGIHEHGGESPARLLADSQTLVDQFADLAVHIFAVFNQDLLMDFLKTSTAYSFEQAVEECEQYNYIPELVFLYSKTGQMKRALYLIIDRLGDVSRAIAFAKDQDDPDLWDDLLDYSMDKPRFIRALLDEVGTAIDPIALVRRIPEGLEIPGLREGLKHMMKEHEIQWSISEGVARVLRSEVGAAQARLRIGQQKGVKFEVNVRAGDHVDVVARDVQAPPPPPSEGGENKPPGTPEATKTPPAKKPVRKHQPGHCALCTAAFAEWEPETLVGFACGHVYHLRHLLERLWPEGEVDEDLLGGGFAFGTVGGREVGAKVTHARLLRERIAGGEGMGPGMGEKGGCVVCKKGGKAG